MFETSSQRVAKLKRQNRQVHTESYYSLGLRDLPAIVPDLSSTRKRNHLGMANNGPRSLRGTENRNFVQIAPVPQTHKKAKLSSDSPMPLMQTPKNPTIKVKEDPMVCRPTETFKDIAGMDEELDKLFRLLRHAVHPELGVAIGADDLQPRGMLLHGPPGSGKTLLAHAIAGEMRRTMIKLAAPEIVSGISGDSEERLREVFRKAEMYAPSILFIDEIESITPKRENSSKAMEERIVAQLRLCLDELSRKISVDVIVIAATNSPDDIDPALRRAGRFGHEITIGIPNEPSRLQILKVLARNLKVSPLVDWDDVAHNTPGYVGADLKALLAEATRIAIDRILNAQLTTTESQQVLFEETKIEPVSAATATPDSITPEAVLPMETSDSHLIQLEPFVVEPPVACPYIWKETAGLLVSGNVVPFSSEVLQGQAVLPEDFNEALKRIQPSAKREGFATIPDVSWDDIGALNDIKDELIADILNPVRYSKAYERLGAAKPSGVLLCGPPGCGKTLLAKAVANQAGLNFISVKGPELLNMYVGESERAVRQVFMRARNSSPCVVFFDEIDALVPRRSATGGNNATERVVTQILTELDGLEPRKLVFMIGATNRPDILDPAILRPGRLDKVSFVDLPDRAARFDIMQAITKKGKKPPLDADVDLQEIARMTEGYSGADLSALVREAASLTLRDHLGLLASEKGLSRAKDVAQHLDHLVVKMDGFQRALKKIRPSVTPEDHRTYQRIKERCQNGSVSL